LVSVTLRLDLCASAPLTSFSSDSQAHAKFIGYHQQSAADRFVARGLADFRPKPFLTGPLVPLNHEVISRNNQRG